MQPTVTEPAAALSAPLPRPRGPLSTAVVDALSGAGPRALPSGAARSADPFGDDLAMALHTCYELHYRGFRGVSPDWEWDPALLAFRAELEAVFLDALRDGTSGTDDVDGLLEDLLVEEVPGDGVSHHLAREGTWEQLREFFVHRSIYHLKEADPHVWAVPRLHGDAKAAFVAVEFDEYGGGRGDRVHSRLFAELLDAADLSPDYLHYLDVAAGTQLAIVNLMSMFGLHRRLRGALVGHFAAAEITTAPSAARLVTALRRHEAPEACVHFFAEHVEADAVHEQIMRRDVVGGLLRDEPELAADVAFGIEATGLLEGRLAERLLDAWRSGRTSLTPQNADTEGPVR